MGLHPPKWLVARPAYALAVSLPLTSASGARRLLHGAVGGPVLVTLAAFAAVAATAAVNGAYFPTSWGWAGLGFGWTALCGLLLRNRIRLGALDLTIVFALWSLLAWTALSSLWSLQSPRSLLEVERTLVYAAAVTAVVVLVSSRVAPGFLAGIATAITSVCAYSRARKAKNSAPTIWRTMG